MHSRTKKEDWEQISSEQQNDGKRWSHMIIAESVIPNGGKRFADSRISRVTLNRKKKAIASMREDLLVTMDIVLSDRCNHVGKSTKDKVDQLECSYRRSWVQTGHI